MHITKNKKISSFWEVQNRSFLRFWPHSGRPKVMKILTLSQHEKHENSMAGVVNLRLGGVQKAGKIESEKTKKTRQFRHPKKRKKNGKKSCGGPWAKRVAAYAEALVTHKFFDIEIKLKLI